MLTKQQLIAQFDANDVGEVGQLFGIPFTPETAEVVIIPAAWDVTVSYQAGTCFGPEDILYASSQVDLFDLDIPHAWQLGVAMLQEGEEWLEASEALRTEVTDYTDWLESGRPSKPDVAYLKKIPGIVNEEGKKFNEWVKQTALTWLEKKKMVALVGGDHSTALGLLQALATQHDTFGILQIDAHADLREAYQGFNYSHASIMYNALAIPQMSKLVQVGIRDYCEEEYQRIQASKGRIVTFFDQDLKEATYEGATWKTSCEQIIAQLPDKVYISFDIDGLDPKLCPHTGTPVAGGFDFHQVVYLLKKMIQAGKKIIGFDLVEVANSPDTTDEWDANVGARLLYKLCNWMAVSQGKLTTNA
ncbi:MAG: agmatinase family protein [Thermonemataceae bacterium]